MNSKSKLTFSTAAIYTSFMSNEPSTYGITVNHRSFLQTPWWRTSLTVHNEEGSANDNTQQQKQQMALQQAVYVLPKSSPHVSIRLQLPLLRSLSVFLKCSPMSQFIGSWLRSPLDQLRRSVIEKKQRQRHSFSSPSSPIRIMLPNSSSSAVTEKGQLTTSNHHVLTPSRYEQYQTETSLSSVSVYFQLPHHLQQQCLTIHYTDILCLYTVIGVTYHCGSISLSVHQVESLDFLMSLKMSLFTVHCNLATEQSMIVRPTPSPSSSQLRICNNSYAAAESDWSNNTLTSKECHRDDLSSSNNNTKMKPREAFPTHSMPWMTGLLSDAVPEEEEDAREKQLNSVYPFVTDAEILHYTETLRYDQEEQYETSYFSSDEEFSFVSEEEEEEEAEEEEEEEAEEDVVDDQQDDHYCKAKMALLNLVQDTLAYIQTGSGAVTEELNALEGKLQQFARM